MVRATSRGRRRAARALVGLAALLLTGCSTMQQPAVEQVATAFEDPGGAGEERCDLLAPATRAEFEESEGAPCEQAIESVPLEGGAVESVEIWGGDAQVRMTGDTVFLTETSTGWRITAASCRPNGEAPYDCEVEGP